jgi:hypothetical protein
MKKNFKKWTILPMVVVVIAVVLIGGIALQQTGVLQAQDAPYKKSVIVRERVYSMSNQARKVAVLENGETIDVAAVKGSTNYDAVLSTWIILAVKGDTIVYRQHEGHTEITSVRFKK